MFLQMCEVENLVLGYAKYNKVCILTDPNDPTSCQAQPMLVTNLFYNASSLYTSGANRYKRDCYLLSQAHVDATTADIVAKLNNIATRSQYAFYAPKGVLTSNTIDFTRSYIQFGGPLSNFTSIADRKAIQDREFQNELKSLEDIFFKYFGMTGNIFSSYYHTEASTSTLNIKFICRAFGEREFSRLVQGDLSFLVGSILFVFCFLCVHLGSVFLAWTGMVMIICSLYVGLFVYWLVSPSN